MAFPVPSLLSLHPESLAPGESTTAVMGINFCDSTQAANFQLWYVPSPHAGERAGSGRTRAGQGGRWGYMEV